MLSKTDNEALTRVGPGSLMGELWRRFWVPALLPGELPDPDCPPVRLRLLGEDLVAFRDSTGKVGVVVEACPHRGASLFFGRNEESGLRCVYHGWKFDLTGACVDMPNEPAESNFKHKIRATAYPAAEWGGTIWVYMGPPELQPGLPEMEWCMVPAEHRHMSKWLYKANFMQGLEGEVDSAHISFLHSWMDPTASPSYRPGRQRTRTTDGSPHLTVQDTDYGFIYGARRNTEDGQHYWRLTPYMLPVFTIIPGPTWPLNCRIYIPIDDENTWALNAMYNPETPLTDDQRAFMDSGVANVPRLKPGTFIPQASPDNDYFMDRELQRTKSFAGIPGLNEQDLAVVQSMGAIYDRTHEHLGTTDMAVIAARRMLLRLARELAAGKQPFAALHPEVFRARPLDIVTPTAELSHLLQEQKEHIVSRF